jgi:hypothetical protein
MPPRWGLEKLHAGVFPGLTPIPGAHAPGYMMPPHFGGSKTDPTASGIGMTGLAAQAQQFTGLTSPSQKPARPTASPANRINAENRCDRRVWTAQPRR